MIFFFYIYLSTTLTIAFTMTVYFLQFLWQKVMLDDDLNCSDSIIRFYFFPLPHLSHTLSLLISYYTTISLSFFKRSLSQSFSLSFTFSLSFSRLCDQTSHNRERSKSVSRLIESENHDYPVQRYK